MAKEVKEELIGNIKGANAKIANVTASVDESTGTPAVSVEMGGTESERSFHFSFSGLKGETGQAGAEGKITSVDVNKLTPTYTESESLTTLSSGEALSTAFGKIKKAISSLISHIADTTKHITATERTTWNGKAPTSHASTATTYGVGTSSNYGHLKITDSKTSTATDTAASAKALKEVNDSVKPHNFELLKTMSLTDINIKSSSTSISTETLIPDIDWRNYGDLKFVLDGTFTFPLAPNGNNTKPIYAAISDESNNSVSFICMQYEKTFSGNVLIENAFQILNRVSAYRVVTCRTTGNEISNEYHHYATSQQSDAWTHFKGNLYITFIAGASGTNTEYVTKFNGTLKIYGKTVG